MSKGNLEKFVMSAKAGIQSLDFTGLPPSRERRKDNCSMLPKEYGPQR